MQIVSLQLAGGLHSAVNNIPAVNCISCCQALQDVFCVCSPNCVSYMLRKQLIYNDMTRYQMCADVIVSCLHPLTASMDKNVETSSANHDLSDLHPNLFDFPDVHVCRYVCCNGDCPCSGRMAEQSCPEFCLCMEVIDALASIVISGKCC